MESKQHPTPAKDMGHSGHGKSFSNSTAAPDSPSFSTKSRSSSPSSRSSAGNDCKVIMVADASNDTSAMSAMRLSESDRDVEATLKQRVVRALRDTLPGTRPAYSTDIDSLAKIAWKFFAHYLDVVGFETCTVKAQCSVAQFHDLLCGNLNNKIPNVKYEYTDGFAEITVYSSPMHNAIDSVDYKDWLRNLPGVSDDLRGHPIGRGMDMLVHTGQDTQTPYHRSTQATKALEMSPDRQFQSILSPKPDRGSIIFEVAYSQDLDHVRRKAAKYLWRSDDPRPRVVVIFDFEHQLDDTLFASMELHFEVHRRLEGQLRKTKIFERGIAYPKAKAERDGNPKEIKFALEELAGDKEWINDALALKTEMEGAQATLGTLEQEIETLSAERVGKGNNPQSKADERRWAVLLKKQLILDLGEGLLETLKTELAVDRETALPISMITRVVNLHKLVQQSALESKQTAMIHSEVDGDDQSEENEEEKDDLADEDYEESSQSNHENDHSKAHNKAHHSDKNGKRAKNDREDQTIATDSSSTDELA